MIVADPNIAAIATLLLVAGVIAAVFVYARSWLDLALLGWLTMTSMLLQQTWWWEVLTILAWIAMPVAVSTAGASAAGRLSSIDRCALVRDARIVAVVFIGSFVFKNTSLLNPSWLQNVF